MSLNLGLKNMIRKGSGVSAWQLAALGLLELGLKMMVVSGYIYLADFAFTNLWVLQYLTWFLSFFAGPNKQ